MKKDNNNKYYFFPPRNKKLESIFSELKHENHAMYDEYYVMKTGKNCINLFREHYKNFKPVLESIAKTKDNPIELHSRDIFTKNYLRADYISTRPFAVADYASLFLKPSKTNRENFYKSLEPSYPEIPRINEYNDALSDIGQPTEHLKNAVDFFHDNKELANKMILDYNGYQIENHPNFSKSVDLMSTNFSNLPESHLEVITYFAASHEQFALVTFEPYMIFILGHALFLQLYYTLHREGAFKYFIQETIIKQEQIRNKSYIKFKHYFNSFIQNCWTKK
jgi:hypothetical protein